MILITKMKQQWFIQSSVSLNDFVVDYLLVKHNIQILHTKSGDFSTFYLLVDNGVLDQRNTNFIYDQYITS